MKSTTSQTSNSDSALLKEVSSLSKQVEDLRAQVALRDMQLNWFKKQLFGVKSERSVVLAGHNQGSFPFLSDTSCDPSPPPPGNDEGGAQSQSKDSGKGRRGGRRPKQPLKGDQGVSGIRFGEGVEIQVVEHVPEELQGLSPDQYEIVDYVEQDRLCQHATSYYIERHRTPKYKLTPEISPEEPVKSSLKVGSLPVSPLPGSYADVSFLVGTTIDKVLYHNPLNRIHQKIQEADIFLSRSCLTRYFHKLGQLLYPVFLSLVSEILQSAIVTADEKPIKAIVDKKKHKMKRGYFWSLSGQHGQVVLHFRQKRNHKTVWELLQDKFQGILLTDDYPGYSRFCAEQKAVIHALCWSHTRRYFVDAKVVEPEKCEKVLAQIELIYRVEKIIKQDRLNREQKAQARSNKSRELVEALFVHIRKELEDSCLLPTSPYTTAIKYALDNEEALKVFLVNPDLPLDTNHLEREHKYVAIGENNWLFCQTEEGAKYLGVLYSLVFSARNVGIDPRKYLTDIINRIGDCPEDVIAELTPFQWKLRQEKPPPSNQT